MALPRMRFEALLRPFEELREQGMIQHEIQTNATLITSGWCDLFARYGIGVGVSVDGPAVANINRRDWIGRPAFDRVMRGIGHLRDAGIEFTAICVVSPETIENTDSIADFFETLGCDSVGFNIEEREGDNGDRPQVTYDTARAFWARLIQRRRNGSHLRVRDIDRLFRYLGMVRAGRKATWAASKYDPIPTIAHNGDTVILSPELSGVSAPEYGNFVIGNVLREPLPVMLGRAHKVRYVQEFTTALNMCREGCPLFSFCLGAQAGNRYFECGTFAVAETNYCRNTRQALVMALADVAQEGDESDRIRQT
ncbi:Radical SAM domain protein [Carbonactinospora thermoautotrophica]|uniref:Radical SAM domain protein n=1 Tax=Carbonactinospora thermoautotrophica TaxID=1469144 RepID=A0A132MKR7_9ACTN|nr:Radical SAM domain protein [Carbonactinospora thermoautotrophica]